MLVVVAASALLPGIAHLRLGAVNDGLAYLGVLAALNAVQFGAPVVDPDHAGAALAAGVAFGLGWALSLVAARSAARLVPAR